MFSLLCRPFGVKVHTVSLSRALAGFQIEKVLRHQIWACAFTLTPPQHINTLKLPERIPAHQHLLFFLLKPFPQWRNNWTAPVNPSFALSFPRMNAKVTEMRREGGREGGSWHKGTRKAERHAECMRHQRRETELSWAVFGSVTSRGSLTCSGRGTESSSAAGLHQESADREGEKKGEERV